MDFLLTYTFPNVLVKLIVDFIVSLFKVYPSPIVLGQGQYKTAYTLKRSPRKPNIEKYKNTLKLTANGMDKR